MVFGNHRYRWPPGLRFIFIFAASIIATAASANPLPPIAPQSSNGSYTVTPRGCNLTNTTLICLGDWIEERSGASGGFAMSSGSYSNKPQGTYEYRTVDYYCDYYYSACDARYSDPVTVYVGVAPPPIDSLETQLDYDYVAKIGQVVGNSELDILIKRTAGGVSGNGVIDSIILEQTSGGNFVPRVPSAAQAASTSWLNSAIAVDTDDINVDGFADVILRNVGAAISGAADQIVFSSADPSTRQPLGVRALDATTRKFSDNLLNYMINDSYFFDTAPLVIYASAVSIDICPSGLITTIETSVWTNLGCIGVFYYVHAVESDYSVFNEDALQIWQDELSVASGFMPSDQAADRIRNRVADILNVDVGGWDIDSIFGAPPSDDPAWQKGLDAFLGVIGIAKAHGQTGNSAGAREQATRDEDVIYIAGRYIFGSSINKLHTAVYYQIPGAGIPTWLSGFDSDDRSLFDGTLIAETNDLRDSPLLMKMNVGEVIPPGNGSRYSYFFGSMVPAHDHYRALPLSSKAPYDAVPEFPACGGCAGRNSNGYVSGLIAATNGQPAVPPGFVLNGITGWEYPVEAHYFGR